MTDRIGQQLGNYRLTTLLGRGGYADVYLGEHIYLRTQAALKVLQMQLTQESIEDFLTEARTLVLLDHPHIVRVLECGVEDHRPFLVMSYAPGGSLRQLCPRDSRLDLRVLVSYVTQIASALQYAHDRKLIHRDVKPENILLGLHNEILLSDFGLVLTAQNTSSQVTKEMVGTVPYMAPEQLQGKPRPASDQYALGIMVYEWLSGNRPFQGTFIEVASQHILAPVPPLCGRVSGISPEVERVVFTALAKDPAQRFNSVQDFALALQQAYKEMQPGPVTLAGSGSDIDKSSQPTFVMAPANQPLQPPLEGILAGESLLPTNLNALSLTQPTYVHQPQTQSAQPTYVITPQGNQPSQPPLEGILAGESLLPTNLNALSLTQPTYVHQPQTQSAQPTYLISSRGNQPSQPPSEGISSGESLLPTNLNTPPLAQPTYVYEPQTQSSQPTYVMPPQDSLVLPPPPGPLGAVQSDQPMLAANMQTTRVVSRRHRRLRWSLISLLSVILLLLIVLGSLTIIPGISKGLEFGRALSATPSTKSGALPAHAATATPTLSPTSTPVPTPAYAGVPTSQPKVTPTPTPTTTYAAFTVTSISMSVSPTSIQGKTCGTYLTVTYTATFHIVANSPGGVIQFDYTVNNGRGETAASTTVNAGQMTKAYSFTWSGNLPADHTYPEPGGVITNSPNSVNSGTLGPTGQCI